MPAKPEPNLDVNLPRRDPPALAAVRASLAPVITGLLSILEARVALVYLAFQDQEGFSPFLASGVLTPAEQSAFDEHTLVPSTDALAYEIWKYRTPLNVFQRVTDRRILPSILASLGWRTFLALPILTNGLLGMLLISKTDQREEFTQEQVRLGETFAAAIATSLENARLNAELSRQLEENQSLHQVTTALLQKVNLAEILSLVCGEVRRLSGAAGSSVAFLEGDGMLRVAYSSGETIHPAEKFPLDTAVHGPAIRKGEPVLINNRAGVRGTVLVLPLVTRNGPVGVLDVVHPARGLTRADVALIARFTEQASVAIEHARLYQQSEDLAIVRERQRLARELHDSVSQSLYGISMVSEAARRQIDRGAIAKARSYLDELVQTSTDALSQMRLLIFGLRPAALQELDLPGAIRERLRAVEERSGLQVQIQSDLPGRLSATVETELYGIAQEALNNVVKHAHAKNVNVTLTQDGKILRMCIEDDGVGFNQADVDNCGGQGLKNIRERAALIGGKVEFISAEQGGTLVCVEVLL